MELMTTSFDQCYRQLYNVLHQTIPEDILGMTSLAVSLISLTFTQFLFMGALLFDRGGVGRSMSKHFLLPVVPSFLLCAMLPSLNGGGILLYVLPSILHPFTLISYCLVDALVLFVITW